MSENQTPFFNLSQLKDLEFICNAAAMQFLDTHDFSWAERAQHYRQFFQNLIAKTEKEESGK